MSSGTGEAPFTELTARRLGPVRRYLVRHPVAADVMVMAVFGLIAVTHLAGTAVSTTTSLQDHAARTVWFTVLVVEILATLVLYWRRRQPLVAGGALLALLVVTLATTGSTAVVDLALALTIYAIAASRRPLVAWTALCTAIVVGSAAIWHWSATSIEVVDGAGEPIAIDTRPTGVIGLGILLLIAMAIGSSVRNRRLHVGELISRANALARERDQQAELARAAERSRIAREMHDVVAHSLSVMIALADGAGAALNRAPDQARTALNELSDTGRTALADMRRVLGVLDSDAPLDPPGSPDLTQLVERFRTAGLTVRTEGLATELPDTGLQLAVFRIVQEALTNTLRYAPDAGEVTVRVHVGTTAVEVEVVDSGGTGMTEQVGAGRGLIGMVERAKVYGGRVDAGPWRSGWRVHAVLPMEGER